MFKKNRTLSLVLLVIVALVAAACGGGGDNGGNDGGSASSVNLSQEFAGGGVTLMYPEGWVAEEASGQIRLASSQEVADKMNSDEDLNEPMPSGAAATVVMTVNATDIGLEADASITDVLNQFKNLMADADTTIGDVEAVSLGDKDGARVSVSSENTDGWLYGAALGDGDVALFIFITAPGERDNWTATLDGIAASITKAN